MVEVITILQENVLLRSISVQTHDANRDIDHLPQTHNLQYTYSVREDRSSLV